VKLCLTIILIILMTPALSETYNPKRGPDVYFKELRYSEKSLHHYIKVWATYFQLDEEIVKGLIEQESGWDHRIVSNKGARGLMQIMPDTAMKDLRMGPDESLFNPYTNIHYGCRYLSNLLKEFNGNYYLALMAYYAGPSRAKRIENGTLWGSFASEIIGYADGVLEKSEKYYPEGDLGVCNKEEWEEGTCQI